MGIFGWKLPSKIRTTYVKFNAICAIIECEAVLSFEDSGRAVIDTSCLLPHRSQFEVVCEKGVVKVDDLVGGQGRSGNFGAYEGPDLLVQLPSQLVIIWAKMKSYKWNHVYINLVEEFSKCVQSIKEGGRANPEWSKRSLITHTVMCAIFESAMRAGIDVEIKSEDCNPTKFVIEGETVNDISTMKWTK